jgi:hypothetical protein
MLPLSRSDSTMCACRCTQQQPCVCRYLHALLRDLDANDCLRTVTAPKWPSSSAEATVCVGIAVGAFSGGCTGTMSSHVVAHAGVSAREAASLPLRDSAAALKTGAAGVCMAAGVASCFSRKRRMMERVCLGFTGTSASAPSSTCATVQACL